VVGWEAQSPEGRLPRAATAKGVCLVSYLKDTPEEELDSAQEDIVDQTKETAKTSEKTTEQTTEHQPVAGETTTRTTTERQPETIKTEVDEKVTPPPTTPVGEQ
jgi:hypothetical protein